MSGFRIRADDLRGQQPGVVDVEREAILAQHRAVDRVIERSVLWRMRQARALAYLAGWRPPTAAQRWWARHEADALAFAEQFEP